MDRLGERATGGTRPHGAGLGRYRGRSAAECLQAGGAGGRIGRAPARWRSHRVRPGSGSSPCAGRRMGGAGRPCRFRGPRRADEGPVERGFALAGQGLADGLGHVDGPGSRLGRTVLLCGGMRRGGPVRRRHRGAQGPEQHRGQQCDCRRPSRPHRSPLRHASGGGGYTGSAPGGPPTHVRPARLPVAPSASRSVKSSASRGGALGAHRPRCLPRAPPFTPERASRRTARTAPVRPSVRAGSRRRDDVSAEAMACPRPAPGTCDR